MVFLALPHGHSGAVAARISGTPIRRSSFDLGADHRLGRRGRLGPVLRGVLMARRMRGPWTYGLPEISGARTEHRRVDD